MKIAVLCEYSGRVRDAFIKRGHDAISCDILPTESPGPHYQGDVIRFLDRYPNRYFDLIIAHPPCTALAVSGNRTYGKGKLKYNNRLIAAKWTFDLWMIANFKSNRVAMENPVGVLNTYYPVLPKPQYIQPWMFGHGETKKTGLWLRGLPELKPTNIVEGREQRIWKMPPSEERAHLRSLTYQGIADAMAEQWG